MKKLIQKHESARNNVLEVSPRPSRRAALVS